MVSLPRSVVGRRRCYGIDCCATYVSAHFNPTEPLSNASLRPSAHLRTLVQALPATEWAEKTVKAGVFLRRMTLVSLFAANDVGRQGLRERR